MAHEHAAGHVLRRVGPWEQPAPALHEVICCRRLGARLLTTLSSTRTAPAEQRPTTPSRAGLRRAVAASGHRPRLCRSSTPTDRPTKRSTSDAVTLAHDSVLHVADGSAYSPDDHGCHADTRRGCAVGAADVSREKPGTPALSVLGGRLAIVAIFTIVVVLPNPEGDGWGGGGTFGHWVPAWRANLERWSVLAWLAAVWHLAAYASSLSPAEPQGASLNAGAGDCASPGSRLLRDDRDLDMHASDRSARTVVRTGFSRGSASRTPR